MKTKSIWGTPPKRLYNLIKIAERFFNYKFRTCIVGCSDGKFLMPFARKGHKVVGYDIDDIAIYGGEKYFPIVRKKTTCKYDKNFKSRNYDLEKKIIPGIIKRVEIENLENVVFIEKKDFYNANKNKQFDIVFTSCSLHYSVNKNLTLGKKTKILQKSVNKNGLLYLDYMMAIDEHDYELYPKNKFYRKGEILTYFDSNWIIIFCKENNSPSFEVAHVDCIKDHFHRFGYLLARKVGNNNAN